jgi:hypothetical protein
MRNPFAKIGRFGRDIGMEVEQLERNVLNKFRSDDLQNWGPFTISSAATTSGAVLAAFWSVVRVDTTSATVTVLLPDPSAAGAGVIYVVNEAAAGTFNLVPISSLVTVQKSASLGIAGANGRVTLIPDGTRQNWIRI